MIFYFIESLFAIEYLKGVHHIVDKETESFSLANLGNEVPVMSRQSSIWRSMSEDPTITFTHNKNGFTILVGDTSKLCTAGASDSRLKLCAVSDPMLDGRDDFRLVVGSKGTSIRNKRNCLKMKDGSWWKRSIKELILVPCKETNYTLFEIKSTSDKDNRDPLNPFGLGARPW